MLTLKNPLNFIDQSIILWNKNMIRDYVKLFYLYYVYIVHTYVMYKKIKNNNGLIFGNAFDFFDQ